MLGRDSYEIGYISHKSLKMKRETMHIPMTIHSPDPGHDHLPKTLGISVYKLVGAGRAVNVGLSDSGTMAPRSSQTMSAKSKELWFRIVVNNLIGDLITQLEI